VKIRKESAVIK